MTLFSWFSDNNNESELKLINYRDNKRVALKGKSMWPVAKVRQIPESLVNHNNTKETNLNSDDLTNEID